MLVANGRWYSILQQLFTAVVTQTPSIIEFENELKKHNIIGRMYEEQCCDGLVLFT